MWTYITFLLMLNIPQESYAVLKRTVNSTQSSDIIPNDFLLPMDCGMFWRNRETWPVVKPKRPRFKQNNRIAYGHEVFDKAHFPPYVSLTIRKNSLLDFFGFSSIFCGGTVISDRLILTAYHCITDKRNGLLPNGSYPYLSPDIIYASPSGLYSNATASRFSDQKLYRIKKFCYGDQYRSGRTDKKRLRTEDYVLLVTEDKMIFDYRFQPACLPNQHIKTYPRELWAVGFGQTQDSDHPNKLQALRVHFGFPCPDPDEFSENFASACFIDPDEINPGSTCPGDSGSGIFTLNSDERITVVGIHSVGLTMGPAYCGNTRRKVGYAVDVPKMMRNLRFHNMLKNCKENG